MTPQGNLMPKAYLTKTTLNRRYHVIQRPQSKSLQITAIRVRVLWANQIQTFQIYAGNSDYLNPPISYVSLSLPLESS